MEKKIVLITGASSKIGMCIAEKLAKCKYDLVLNYNTSLEKAEKLRGELINKYNIDVLLIKADLREEKEIKNIIDCAIKKYGRIDILINNAAIEHDNTFENKTKEEFMDVLNVNLIAPFLLSKYASKYMIKNKYGKIINIASTNGIDTYYPSSLDYDASKAGLISLTHNLAIELAPYITVNAIAPGWTNTDMNKNLSEEQKKKINERILLKRFANPDEIANVVAFLASPEASYINNEVIRVDGGSFNDSI